MRDGARSSLCSRNTPATSDHLYGLLVVGPAGPIAHQSMPCGPQTKTVEAPSVRTFAADALESPLRSTAATQADQQSNGLPAKAATGIVTSSTLNARRICASPYPHR